MTSEAWLRAGRAGLVSVFMLVLAAPGCGGQDRKRQGKFPVRIETSAYCEILQEDAPPTLCRRMADLPASLETGVAAFSPPAAMTRGETVTVEFAVARGRDLETAEVLLAGPDGRPQQFRPKIGRFMSAELTGEGFEISPSGVQEKDLFLSGSAVWRWRVKAVRADRHLLSLSAWVKVKLPDDTLKPVWFKTVHRQVAVPVRFFPERVADFVTDSGDWIGRLDAWVKALATLVASLSALLIALRYFGRKKPAA